MPFLFSLGNFPIIQFLNIHEDVKIVKKLISMVLVQIKKNHFHIQPHTGQVNSSRQVWGQTWKTQQALLFCSLLPTEP